MAEKWQRIYGLDSEDPKDGPFGVKSIKLPNVATANLPAASSSNEGNIVYDSTANKVKYSDGSSWALVAGAGGISDLDDAFDGGNTIDGSVTGTRFQVGDGAVYGEIWGDGTDVNLTTSGGDLKIIPSGGDVVITGNLSVSGTYSPTSISTTTITASGLITASGGISGDGWSITDTTGAMSITGTGGLTVASGDITASSGDVVTGGSLVGPALASASAGNVNLAIDASGTGTITIAGTSTGAITLTTATSLSSTLAITGATTATGAIYANGGLDRSAAASLSIGGTNANAVSISKSGVTTTIAGALTVNEAFAANAGITVDTDKFVVSDATGNTTTLGTLTVGADAAGADVKFFDSVSGDYILYDVSASRLLFEDVFPKLMDDTKMLFGDDEDWTLLNDSADSDSLDIDGKIANQAIKFGTNIDTDIIWNGTTGVALTCDASADSITVSSTAQLIAVGNGTGTGLVIPFHATNSPSDSVQGSLFFEVDAKKLWVYDGTSWVGTTLA